MQALLTLYEGHYHRGVAALVNSAISAGFDGRFYIGYRDDLPPWTSSLERLGDHEFAIARRRLTFFKESPRRHLGFHKPFAALSVLDRSPEIETLFYADPDITFLAPWEFFRQWAVEGVGLVGDVIFREVSLTHPWRREWKELMIAAGGSLENNYEVRYPNGGFFGVKRSDMSFLELWRDVTLAHEREQGNTNCYQLRDRWKAIVSDQDLLAAALMAWPGRVSMLGPEAMGFTGYFFILSHAIESPKPWAKNFLAFALRGFPPTQAAKHYRRFTQSPICIERFPRRWIKEVDLMAAQIVSRFYRR